MKKIYTYMMMVLMALPMLTLTSCDRDAADAYTLNGQWEGVISTYYVDRWGLTGEDYRTCIQFYQRDNYGGTGFEVDYDVRDRWNTYYYSPIEWEVRNGIIRINYIYDNYYVEISRYSLRSDRFFGYMYDGTCRDIEFSLYHVSNVYWDKYRYNGGNWRRSAVAEGDSVNVADDDIIVNGESVARGAFARAIKEAKANK
jgi:hypothetical protein